jgi:hypothetical protein
MKIVAGVGNDLTKSEADILRDGLLRGFAALKTGIAVSSNGFP